jgi:hypothetical protein
LKRAGQANVVIVLIVAIISSCLLSFVVVEQENFLDYLGLQANGMKYNA